MVAVLAALLMVVLFASVAFAVDMSRLRHERHVVQTAVDFGALSAAGLLPAQGAIEGGRAETMAINVALANAPGLTASDVNVTFRCVVLNQPAGTPWLSPDLDFACSDAGGGGFSQFLSTGGGPGWKIRGKRAFHICDPDVGDKCNAIVVRASNDVQYFFAPVIGHNVGNTGSVAGAACKGFCGNPSQPLDIVLVLDRTGSLSAAELANVKSGAQEVLDAYDPSLHQIGLVVLPYGDPGNPVGTPVGGDPQVGCRDAASQYYPAVPPRTYRPVPPNPIPPAWEPPEPRPSGGSWDSSPWGMVGVTNNYAKLSSAINCLRRATAQSYTDPPGGSVTYPTSGSGNHTNLSDALTAGANMLRASRPSVPDVMIFLSDGEANQPVGYNPCQRTVTAANSARALNPTLSIYTIGYGIDGIRCNDTSGTYSGSTSSSSYATRMYAAIANQPSSDRVGSGALPPGTCPDPAGENADGDFYYCLPSTGDLDVVFRQIVVATIAKARLIEFD